MSDFMGCWMCLFGKLSEFHAILQIPLLESLVDEVEMLG